MNGYFTLSETGEGSGLERNGKKIGFLHKARGYYYVKWCGKNVFAHRVVYSIANGVSLEKMKGLVIDHIDGNKANNNPLNLRLVKQEDNNRNTYQHRNGKLLGSTYRKDIGKYESKIVISGKKIILGYFDTEEAASNAYFNFKNTQ